MTDGKTINECRFTFDYYCYFFLNWNSHQTIYPGDISVSISVWITFGCYTNISFRPELLLCTVLSISNKYIVVWNQKPHYDGHFKFNVKIEFMFQLSIIKSLDFNFPIRWFRLATYCARTPGYLYTQALQRCVEKSEEINKQIE